MRILRVIHQGKTFFASLSGKELTCLDKSLGFDAPIPIAQVRALPPVAPTKIVGVNFNSRALAAQAGRDAPTAPDVFFKPPSALCGPGDAVLVPAGAGPLMAEAQLAVVLGKTAHKVPVKDAAAHIFGYCLAVDVTAPELAAPGGSLALAKSFDTFLPLGPWVETDVADPMSLVIAARTQDCEPQEGIMADMALSPAELVSALSHAMTLNPGDTILCGATQARLPVAPGDELRAEITGVGLLINPVMAEPHHIQ